MTTTLEQLKAVRDLLEDPEHWTKGILAQNAEGGKTGVYSNDATCWCLRGAIYKVEPSTKLNYGAYERLLGCLDEYDGLISFNDDPETTHEDVLALLDRAIEGLPDEPEA